MFHIIPDKRFIYTLICIPAHRHTTAIRKDALCALHALHRRKADNKAPVRADKFFCLFRLIFHQFPCYFRKVLFVFIITRARVQTDIMPFRLHTINGIDRNFYSFPIHIFNQIMLFFSKCRRNII